MASEPVMAAVHKGAGGITTLLNPRSGSAFHPRELATDTLGTDDRVNGHEGALPPLPSTLQEHCRSRTVQQTVEPCTQEVGFSDVLREFAQFALSIDDNYKHHIRQFVTFAETSDAETILDLVRDYYRELNKTNYSASTIRCKRQAVKDRLRRALSSSKYSDADRARFEHELREIDRDPALKCPGGANRTNGTTKVVTAEEFERLMKGARSDRQRRFIEFLYATGARVSEMTGVKLADCKAEGNVVAVRLRGKGNKKASYKERGVWITKAMYERILETFGGEEYLFETSKGERYHRSYVSNQIAKLTKHVLERRVSAHKFRHTFATRMLRDTGRVQAVSQYLGHSDVTITLRIYSHDAFSASDVLGPEAVA